MTSRNPTAWTELEIHQDALEGKLRLLNPFIEWNPLTPGHDFRGGGGILARGDRTSAGRLRRAGGDDEPPCGGPMKGPAFHFASGGFQNEMPTRR